MDAQQLTDGLTAAQTVMTVLGSMGAFEAAKYIGEAWQKRRESRLAAQAEQAKAEREQEEHDHQHARELRKDRIAEYDAIIAQKDADIAQRDAAYKAYQKFAHDRLDLASARILELHAEKVVTAGQMARVEERLKACEDDRLDLRQRLEDSQKACEELHQTVKVLERRLEHLEAKP